MLPNVLPHTEADHVPVLADRVRELLAVRPGETVVDATFGAGGHARLLAEDLAGQGKLVAIDRDPPRIVLRPASVPEPGVGRRLPPRRLRVVLAQLAANDVKADAILLDLGSRRCRSTGPSAASRTRPTRRSTCGWTRRPEPTAATIVQHVGRA
jgi:16S rRNA (cytosine1402-N4)-methyltransferase